MAHFNVDGLTPQVEMLHVGCVFYSIAVRQVFDYYYDEVEDRISAELPGTDGVLFANAIRKCWSREYASMEDLNKDGHDLG
jgi:hypothetical protein